MTCGLRVAILAADTAHCRPRNGWRYLAAPGGGRQELWNGNRERWRNFLSWNPEQSVISWAWHTHAAVRDGYAAAAADPASAHLRFVRLASHRDTVRFLDEARRAAGCQAVLGRDEFRRLGDDVH